MGPFAIGRYREVGGMVAIRGFFSDRAVPTAVYRTGHYGAALLCYAPVALAATFFGAVELAILGGAVTVGLTPLPDYDQRVPLIEHRGVTHTVGFAALVGLLTGGVGFLAGRTPEVAAEFGSPLVLGGFGALVGALAILAHLAADVITPAGLRPFWPVSDRHYSLDLVRAKNPVANYLLLAAGVATTVAVAWIAGLGTG